MAFSTTKIQKVSISPALLVSWLYFISKATASYSSGDSKTVTVQAHLSSPHLLLRLLLTLFFLSLSLSLFPSPFFLFLLYVDIQPGAGLPWHTLHHAPGSHSLSSLLISGTWAAHWTKSHTQQWVPAPYHQEQPWLEGQCLSVR